MISKVLMADDEPEILSIMAKRMTQHGYDVIAAEDGQEAWEKIQSESPDVVLLDLSMPKMDGFEVVRHLRENPPTEKKIPIIIISALVDQQNMKRGNELGVDQYLVKPCQISHILEAIHLLDRLNSSNEDHGEDGSPDL